MSRYSGWNNYQYRRPSPVSATEAIPNISDEDFTYITSEDLLNHPSVHTMSRASRHHHAGRSASPPALPEDDVLIVKNKGVTYPAHFPAYSIFDGKVRVRDVRDMVGEMMELSDRATRDVKLLYKGRNLSTVDAPVRDYGVKNNSEILAVVREIPRHRDSRDDGLVSSGSSEDVVVVPREQEPAAADPPRKRRPKKHKKKAPSAPSPEFYSHRGDNPSNFSIPPSTVSVPSLHHYEHENDERYERSPSPLPVISAMPPCQSSAPSMQGGPAEKLESISADFNAELMPVCNEFMANPPDDDKKLGDEHRRLTETILQRVLLKLDEVEPGEDEEARATRRQYVKHAQSVLHTLDKFVGKTS